uniref:Uncharacterized protein n=1 Tax=Avena sativa TaxID=4498 RepID=A0ACD5YKJ4_AVESA
MRLSVVSNRKRQSCSVSSNVSSKLHAPLSPPSSGVLSLPVLLLPLHISHLPQASCLPFICPPNPHIPIFLQPRKEETLKFFAVSRAIDSDYMSDPGGARCLPTKLDLLASDLHNKQDFYKNAYVDYVSINNALHAVMEEKGKLQQEQNVVVQLSTEKDQLIADLNAQKEQLTTKIEEQAAEIESLKEQLKARESCHALLALKASGLQISQSAEVSAQKDQLTTSYEEQAAEIETLKEQLKASELALQGTGLLSSQSGIVYLRSMKKRQRQSNGNGEDADYQGLATELEDAKKELSDIHSKLIKGFVDISSTGGRNISIKNIGQLSDKPFLQACLKKLTPKEATRKASELCKFWQMQLLNPEWNPAKTLSDEDIPKVPLHHIF